MRDLDETSAENEQLLRLLRERGKLSEPLLLLGAEPLAVDGARGFARIAYEAGSRLCNPMGVIQGGFLCAMLDEAMAVAALAQRAFEGFVPTLELKTSFLRPAPPGRLLCEAWVVHAGRRAIFTEARLCDAEGRPLCTATGTALFRERDFQGRTG